MRLKDKLEIKLLLSLVFSIINRLISIVLKFSPTPISTTPQPKPRPIKKIVDTIDNIVPLPWRNKK